MSGVLFPGYSCFERIVGRGRGEGGRGDGLFGVMLWRAERIYEVYVWRLLTFCACVVPLVFISVGLLDCWMMNSLHVSFYESLRTPPFSTFSSLAVRFDVSGHNR